MDVIYTLIGFSLGIVVASVIVMIGQGITTVSGMFFYPLLYNSYNAVYEQLPANSSLQSTVNQTFQNSVNYVSQAETYVATAVNTLAMTLQIIAFIGVFIIILDLLMALAMPRTVAVPAGY